MKEYALYKGEECLAFGTIEEIANVSGLTLEEVKVLAQQD